MMVLTSIGGHDILPGREVNRMYQIRPDGTILTEDADEALALQQRIYERAMQAQKTLFARKATPTVIADLTRAKEMIETTATSGKTGIQSISLAKAFGLEDPKGLATHVKAARELIIKHAPGRPVEDFLWRERGNGGTRWYANAERLKEIGLLEDAQ
jgi:hypothetical protein